MNATVPSQRGTPAAGSSLDSPADQDPPVRQPSPATAPDASTFGDESQPEAGDSDEFELL
jgi:hypothetical protein